MNQSLLNGLEILAKVGESVDGQSLQALAAHLDRNASSVHHLVRTLLDAGYLEKTDRPVRYRLGPSLFGLIKAHHRNRLYALAGDLMRRLQDEIGDASVGLCEMHGGEVMHALHLNRRRPGVLDTSRLEPLPPYTTGEALVFQAFATEQPLEAFRARYPFFDYGAHAWDSADALNAFLDEVRDLGYAFPRFGQEPDWVRIAAPVFAPSGRLLAALGIFKVAPASGRTKAKIREMVEVVVGAAQGITEGLSDSDQQEPRRG